MTTESNTTAPPDPLALKIRNDLSREATNRTDWVAIQVDLCHDLYAARDRFKDDIGFGQWFDRNVGDLMNKDERAAYVAMGGQLDNAKQVLVATRRSSIKQIYLQEFRPRFLHMEKPVKSRKPQKSDEYEAAMGIIERRAAAGESLGYQDIQREAGISSTAVRRALAVWDAKQEQASDFGKFLSSSAREKLDASIRQYKKQLDLEVQGRIQAEVRRLLDEHILPSYADKLAKADAIIAADAASRNSRLFPFSPKQYRSILAALHPDDSSSPEKKSELFQLFKAKEDRLKNPIDRDEILAKAGMPKTYAEMMARRDEVRAANSARSKAAAARKKG